MSRLRFQTKMNQVELSIDIHIRRTVVSELFKKYYTDMCKVAYNITRDKIVSEDIVQNVFLKLFNTKKEQVIEYPQTYLKRVTLNESIDYYRKTVKLNTIDIDTVSSVKVEENNENEREELLIRVNKAIDELPSKCRLIFVLKRKEGLTNQEIADELDLSIKTVENQMTIAFKFLREKLGIIKLMILFSILDL